MPDKPLPLYQWSAQLADGTRFQAEAAYAVVDVTGHMALRDADDKTVFLAEAGLGCTFQRLGKVTAAGPPRDPQAGDPVIIRGTIRQTGEGSAHVELYRSDPPGVRVIMQCGALDLDEEAVRAAAKGAAEQVKASAPAGCDCW